MSTNSRPQWLNLLYRACTGDHQTTPTETGGHPHLPVLVLCRTKAQAASLQRLIARHGGLLGLQIMTPLAYAHSMVQHKLILPDAHTGTPPVEDAVAGSPALTAPPATGAGADLLKQIGRRHKLLDLAAQWAGEIRLHRLSGGDTGGISPALLHLADHGWGESPEETVIAQLLNRLGGLDREAAPGTGEGNETILERAGLSRVFHHGYPPGPEAGDAPRWEQKFIEQWLDEDKGLFADHRLYPIASWEWHLLNMLGATPMLGEIAGTASTDTIPTIPYTQVPDVAAEARLAAQKVHQALHGAEKLSVDEILILVPDQNTAGRVRDTFQRNDLPVAMRESAPLGRHPLASVVKACSGWFNGTTNPRLRANHLQTVLGAPIVARKLTGDVLKEAKSEIKRAAPPDEYLVLKKNNWHCSTKNVTRALLAAKIIEAPLNTWIGRMKELAEKETEGTDASSQGISPVNMDWAMNARAQARWAAKVIQKRLERLRLIMEGKPLSRKSSMEESVPVDPDNDQLVGQDDDMNNSMAPEDLEAEAAAGAGAAAGQDTKPGSTFKSLRDFLLDCKLYVYSDPIGRAILGVLKSNGDLLSNQAAAARILNGEADCHSTSDGVEIMEYSDYDGRPARLLLLLGIHNKGVALTPAPDPLAGKGEFARLRGRLHPVHQTKFNLIQALRATAEAQAGLAGGRDGGGGGEASREESPEIPGPVLAILTSRDSTGRSVVPPVELQLEDRSNLESRSVSTDTFGLKMERLPETGSRDILVSKQGEGDTFPEPPPESLPENLRHMAVQASAEWYRAGLGAGMELPPIAQDGADQTEEEKNPTLAAILGAELTPHVPGWVAPYMGYLSQPNQTGRFNPKAPVSNSSFFEPLNQCLYKLFIQRILGLREEEEFEDEMNARDKGTAIHTVLEEKGAHITWKVDDEEQTESAREEALAILREATKAQFNAVKEENQHMLPISQAAGDGLCERWNVRWSAYVADRIKAPAEMEKDIIDQLVDTESYKHSATMLKSAVREYAENKGANTVNKHVKNWLLSALMAHMADKNLTDEFESFDGFPAREKPKYKDNFRNLVNDQAFLNNIEELKYHYIILARNCNQIHSETPLAAKQGEEVYIDVGLKFASEPIQVRGRIDSLRMGSLNGKTHIQILDYKAGKKYGKAQLKKKLDSLQSPQLMLYALATQEAVNQGILPVPIDEPVFIEAVGYDYLQGDKRNGLSIFPLTSAQIKKMLQIQTDLVGRLTRGDWRLRPHPESCPHLVGRGGNYCPFTRVCRLVDLPKQASMEGDEPNEQYK